MTVSEHTLPVSLLAFSCWALGLGGIRWTRPTLPEGSLFSDTFSFSLQELGCKDPAFRKKCFFGHQPFRFLGPVCTVHGCWAGTVMPAH